MRKRYFVIGIILFVLMLLPWVYKEFITKSFRYNSPENAFERTAPIGTEMLKIVQQEDAALVIYKEDKANVSCHLLSKDEKGWTPMNYYHNSAQKVIINSGVVYLYEIGDKYIIHSSFSVDENPDNQELVIDSSGKKHQIYIYEHGLGGAFVYSLCVMEEMPDDYTLFVNGTDVKFD